jgi:ATP-binding cassette, subfamily B, multidrug efflux pump
VLGALRDLRHDLFRHLETRPASFYDRVAVGRVMTRVTNDVEQLFQLLSGLVCCSVSSRRSWWPWC